MVDIALSARIRGLRVMTVAWLLAAALPLGCAPVRAQTAPVPVMHATRSGAAATPSRTVAWSELTGDEQQALAPLRSHWMQASAAEQSRFRRIAARWLAATAERRAAIERRLARWVAMTPGQRAALAARYEEFRRLPPQRQQDLRDAYRHFHALPPAQRAALRQRFQKMTPDERAAFVAGADATRRNRDWHLLMADAAPERREAMRAMWLALDDPRRQALRHHLRALSAAQREDLRGRLLAMTPAARNAFIAGLPAPPRRDPPTRPSGSR